MKITYLGQAGVLFETNGLRIVVDPYLSDSCGAQNPAQHRRQRINEAYLNLSPQVVICTHCHLDHLDPETLRHYLTPEGNVTAMAPGEGWRKLREFGGKNNYVLFNRHVEWTQGQAHFRAVKAVHSDPDAVGVILEAEGGRWYLSGDTLYSEEILQPVIKRAYTDMVIGDMTGNEATEDLVLALPTETESGGVNLELLTYIEGEFRAKQTLAVGAGSYNGCAALHAGQGLDGKPWLVLDGWAGSGGTSLSSNIVRYDEETGFLQLYTPPGVWDMYGVSQRYDTSLLSMDVDGNGTIDIPSEVGDGGELRSPLDKRLKFLLWRDYATPSGGHESFGVYDSEYRFFVPLPSGLHGRILLRSNAGSTGWLVCSEDGETVYLEIRVVDAEPSQNRDTDYTRIANIGDQQLQARLVEPYFGLSMDKLTAGTVMIG